MPELEKTRYDAPVLAVIVALTLFAGPASGVIAIEWRAEEPDGSLRESVRDAVAQRDDRPRQAVQDRALARARAAVSREHPIAIRTLHAELRAGLDQADAAYREGRFVDARDQLDRLLATLHTQPELPGAPASAREAHLLRARIAWAEADPATAERALVEALRLDPEARLAARRAPPELIARYEALQADLLGARELDWITPSFTLTADQEVEIDGVSGVRPVPPGAHFVVVYQAGHEPIAAWRELDSSWTIPAAAERISTDADAEHEAICVALGLEILVLAERREAELGLQGYRCGVGWGSRWAGPREQLDSGAAAILAGPFDASAASLADPWQPTAIAIIEPEPPSEGPRPWYRRGWVWGTSAGVVGAIVGGVVAGVIVGGRGSTTPLEVDADQFIGGR